MVNSLNARGWSVTSEPIKKKICTYKNPDLICIAETHLSEGEDITIDGYKFYGNPRQSVRASGGVGILVKDSVYSNYFVSLSCCDTEGILAVNLTHKKTGSLSVLVSNYLPPAGSQYGKDCDGFFDRLLMLAYEHNGCEMLLYCGDFNARIGNIQDAPYGNVPARTTIDKTINSHGNALIGFLNDNNCCVLNGRMGENQFTCTTYNGSSVVDYVITPCEMLRNVTDFHVYSIEDLVHELSLAPATTDSALPDHNLISFTFRSSGLYVEDTVKGIGANPRTSHTTVPHKFKTGYMNNDRIRRVIPKLIEQIETIKETQSEIDTLYTGVCAEISTEMKMHLPNKRRRKTAYKPYWSTHLSELWADMRTKYSKIRSSLKGKPKRQFMREHYATGAVLEFQNAVHIFDAELRTAKRKYNCERIDSLDKLVNCKDPKKFWDEVNKLGPRKKRGVVCEALDSRGQVTRDPEIVLKHWETEYRRLYSEAPMGEFDDDFYLEKMMELDEKSANTDSTWDLNREITLDEVRRSIFAGKKNKACGNDEIPYEVIQNENCVHMLHKLFTICFQNGLIPSEWSRCIIVPVSKGSRSINTQPLTFRGLAMQSCVYKCYSYILNRRLDTYLEANHLIEDVQNGFRRGRGCVDHIFSLSETIRLNTGSPKSKVFACFFDMRRAFDEVDRNLLLRRLQNVGVNGNMYRAMAAIYNNPMCKVKLGESGVFTDWIVSNYGTLQGDVISPKNFSIEIDVLLQELNSSGLGIYYGPNQNEKFSCLAFADDIVVVAPSASDLQKLINIVYSYCKRWRMTVNTSKTKTMVFRKNMQTKRPHIQMCYGSDFLEQVDRYKYLGVVFDEVLKFNAANEMLASSGSRALGSIISKSKVYQDIGYRSYTKLIDTCVNTVTDYCSELLGHDTPKGIVDVQLRAARFYLGAPKHTALCCLTAEMGWLPASYRRQISVLRYYNRLMRMDLTRIPRRVFESTVNTPRSWAWRTRDLLNSLGLDLYWSMGCPVPEEMLQFQARESMKEEWRKQVASKAKLRFYKQIKTTTTVSPYVAANIPKKHRSLITRLMCGNLKLRVETGRIVKELLPERLCSLCDAGAVEDEEHFLLSCTGLSNVRCMYVDGTDTVSSLMKHPFKLGKLISSLWKRRAELIS